jgi:hypothetical protein
MANVNASSRQNQSNIDDTQRSVVGGPVFKKIRTKPLTKINLKIPVNSINRFNYQFGGKI